MHPDFDTAVKLTTYTFIAETAAAPSSAEVTERVGARPAEVEAAFGRLHVKRLLVPEPGDPSLYVTRVEPISVGRRAAQKPKASISEVFQALLIYRLMSERWRIGANDSEIPSHRRNSLLALMQDVSER